MLDAIMASVPETAAVEGDLAKTLGAWLDAAYPLIDEDNEEGEERFARLRRLVRIQDEHIAACRLLEKRLPLCVYYSTYFTVRPRIQLSALAAAREASGDLDEEDEEYDFGNQCLLKLLGFTAKELSDLVAGAPAETKPYNVTDEAHQASVVAHQKKVDERQYVLNAASVDLTTSIRQVWVDEQVTLRLVVDGQYLKVGVVDDLGVGQTRNLVCEGLTDMFYVAGLSHAFRDAGKTALKDSVALVPAHSASKVLYYCTLLQSQRLKVATLLDSDTAGEKAASQVELVRLLSTKEILRTKDHYKGPVAGPEIEEMLRETLLGVARDDLGWDSTATATSQPNRRTVDILASEHKDFSKYRLARAFLRWLSTHTASDLTADEQAAVASLFTAANKALA